MNEFDVDALRDPTPPEASTGHREAVRARARSLHIRSRVNRLTLSAVALVAVLAIAVGITAQRDEGSKVTVGGPTMTEPSSIADRFVPPTTTEDGITTMPVTLPSGETFTMRYPESLRIAQLGFAGSVDVDWPENPADRCCGRTEALSLRYATIADVYGEQTPITTYDGATGDPVPLLRTPQAFTSTSSLRPQVDLAFQFGPWLVRVAATNFDDAGRALWARSLSGRVNENGYLLLRAAAPFRMGTMFGGQFGAPVAESDAVELTAYLHCAGEESDSARHRRYSNGDGTYGVSWCVDDIIHVAATGTRRFVDQVDNGLQVSGFTPAPRRPTVTTTTTVPAPPSQPTDALSASFVSPEHGWVLERGGTVTETTDGGATWHPVGTLRAELRRIRFADAQHGFAFDDGDYATETGVWATDDGGATWRRLSTPFPDPLELAISKGTVYVVASGDDPNTISWRVWSSPARDLDWKQDPIVLGPTAAPAYSFILAFAGNDGWLVEDSRGAVAGARLTSDGTWASWTPPCVGTGGGRIDFAASTSDDVVASCSEGVWTGPRTAYGIYFSYDGGETFQRSDAPTAGPVGSPTRGVAVIGDAGTLWRTDDDGQSWNVVARVSGPDAYVDEIGFTTSTQGFAIFDTGTMLMTYDAGATWRPVTQR